MACWLSGVTARKKIRVGRDVNRKDFTVTHSYSNGGGYIFEVEGSTIKKAWGQFSLVREKLTVKPFALVSDFRKNPLGHLRESKGP